MKRAPNIFSCILRIQYMLGEFFSVSVILKPNHSVYSMISAPILTLYSMYSTHHQLHMFSLKLLQIIFFSNNSNSDVCLVIRNKNKLTLKFLKIIHLYVFKFKIFFEITFSEIPDFKGFKDCCHIFLLKNTFLLLMLNDPSMMLSLHIFQLMLLSFQ